MEGVGFLRKFENRIDRICLLMCERRKSEAETILKFLDWDIKGTVMPLAMTGDSEEDGGLDCCRPGEDGDLLSGILSWCCLLYIS